MYGNASGFLEVTGEGKRVSGLLGTAVMVDCLAALTAGMKESFMRTGSLGLRVGGTRLGLGVSFGIPENILGLCCGGWVVMGLLS